MSYYEHFPLTSVNVDTSCISIFMIDFCVIPKNQHDYNCPFNTCDYSNLNVNQKGGGGHMSKFVDFKTHSFNIL